MEFYFTTWNHHPDARDVLLDVVLPLAAGLRDLGHAVEIGEAPPRRGVTNVVVEYFRDPAAVAELLQHDFVLVGTEFADGTGFNSARTRMWRRRYRYFKVLARQARAIWVICDNAAAGYAPHAPSVQLALGWSPSLEAPRPAMPPRYDICAYGKLGTAARKSAIDKLSARLSVTKSEFVSKADRDAMLQSALFCYGFRPHANVVNASTTRIVSALMQHVPVLQERVAGPSPFVEEMEIVDGPDEVLARWDDLRARRDDILARQMAAWRRMPAAEIMAPAVAAMRPRPRRGWVALRPARTLRARLAEHAF
ncbi:hypothetical protein [Desertibaculum subflavum]|uniref:hypothetical protein n=1 Tax=Desertibaculum subflavum TaxID=2268458 RepID=UPI000E66FB24